MGAGLTQSIKSLTEKVKENPYWGEERGGVKKMWSFSIFRQFLTNDSFTKVEIDLCTNDPDNENTAISEPGIVICLHSL